MSDTEFGFSGKKSSNNAATYLNTLNVALDGVQLSETNEVSLEIYAKGGKSPLTASDSLETGKTYVVKVSGKDGSRFEGQSIQREFVYGKLDLAKASIVTLVDSDGTAPSKDSKFADIVKSVNGFATAPPSHMPSLIMSTLRS